MSRDRGNARPGPAGGGRGDRPERRDRQLDHRGQWRGQGIEARIDVLHGRRRRECLRAARPPSHAGDRARDRRPGAVHPTSCAAESGPAGDVLCEAGRRRDHGVAAGNPCRPVPRRAVRGRASRVALDEGHDGQQRRPHHRAIRRAHQHRHRDLCDRQPCQGCLGWRCSGRQRGRRPARDLGLGSR